MSSLSKSELDRYSRHLLLPEVGLQGQQRLKKAKIIIIGAGGLGSPVVLYLAAAGIGTIALVDFDRVERSNLQRQIVYIDEDVGLPKVECAASRVRQLNPQIQIEAHDLHLNAENALDILSRYDVVIDGSDNFTTRYLVNDACVLLNKPNVHGAIYRFEGQASIFSYKDGPCYRCLFPEPPLAEAVPNCAEGGVLGVMAGLIGCIQATETIKIILNIGESLAGKLLIYDALYMSFDTLPVKKNPDCPVCGVNPRIKQLEDTVVSCQTKEIEMSNVISASELQNELKAGQVLTLLDVRTAEEVALGKLPNSKHIPLADLLTRYSELDTSSDIVVYCKSGVRSLKALHLLAERGFAKVRNLRGGITAWAHDVDQSINT